MERDMPKLRRNRAMRELQHFHDASQESQSPGMSLLRFHSINSKELPEVRFQVRLFFWRGFGTIRRAFAQAISEGPNRQTGSRHRAHQAAIPGNARCIYGWSSR